VEAVLGLVNQATIGTLVNHMAEGNASEGLVLLNRLVAEGVELGQLVDQVVAYLCGVMLVRISQAPELLDLPQDASAHGQAAQRMSMPALLAAVKVDRGA
jgi:DNA polymerase III gamma/tau subunit